MYWDYLGKGGDYAQAIKASATGYTDLNYSYTGLGLYDMSKVDLAVFLGCETASSSTSNLPKYVYNKGTKTAIGWIYKIYTDDAYTWTTKFLTKLKSGSSVKTARTYANSYTGYLDSNIKSQRVYGSTSTTISSSDESIISSDFYTDDNIYNINMDISVSSDLVSNLNYELALLFEDFSSQDYVYNLVESDDFSYYDYNLLIGGVKSNVGYTIILNKDKTKIISIIDNISEYSSDLEYIEGKVNTFDFSILTDDYKLELKNTTLNEISNYDNYLMEIYDDFLWYDVPNKKMYYVIAVKSTDLNFNTTAVYSYKYEL